MQKCANIKVVNKIKQKYQKYVRNIRANTAFAGNTQSTN